MKESLSYKVLITMQKRHRLKQNSVLRGESYEADNDYHYDGCGKRLSDLCNYGYAERKGDDDNGYLRYQVSDKGLSIKNFKDFKENTLKMKQYRASAKKTREESAVKKECKSSNVKIRSKDEGFKDLERSNQVQRSPELRFRNDQDSLNDICMFDQLYYKSVAMDKEGNHYNMLGELIETPNQPRYKRLRSTLTGK